MIYIAYSSNMSKERMLARCPNAEFLTKGIVYHCTLQFHYYADAIHAHDYEMPVVLWKIPDSETSALERAEGYPKHYDKQELVVYPLPYLSEDEMVKLVGADNISECDFYNNTGVIGTAFVMTDWKRTEWEKHSEQTPIEYAQHLITGYKENNFIGWHLHDLWYALSRGEENPESRS